MSFPLRRDTRELPAGRRGRDDAPRDIICNSPGGGLSAKPMSPVRMLRFLMLVAILFAVIGMSGGQAAMAMPAADEADEFDPAEVSEVDAIDCRLAVPDYNGFALAIGGEDGVAARRNWRQVKSGNPFMNEYQLLAPISVAGGHATRRIAFTSNAIVAILDLPDPAGLAREEQIANAADPEPLIAELVASGKASREQIEAEIPFRKFLGERVLADVTEPGSEEQEFGIRTTIARTVSNATSHPGKTFYGCTYRIELIDRDGNPL